MIINNEPLSAVESLEYIKDKEAGDSDLVGFIKKFVKLKPEEAKEIRKKIESLKNLKVKSEHISKIIDTLPENKEDLNKIFVDIGLDEDESNKILDIVKQYRWK